MRVDEERAIRVDRLADSAGDARAFGDGAVEIDQTKAARLVTGAHRIPRVHIDRFRPARESAPHPFAHIRRRDRGADAQRHGAESALQLADPERAACR